MFESILGYTKDKSAFKGKEVFFARLNSEHEIKICIYKNTLNSSSRLHVNYKICVPKNFSKFIGRKLCQNLFFNKVAGLSLQLNEKGVLT